jgi:hypothetical protein
VKYVINDTFGDQIVVSPQAPDGPAIPRLLITFIEKADGGDRQVQMLLTDRQWADLRKAGNQAIAESSRIG